MKIGKVYAFLLILTIFLSIQVRAFAANPNLIWMKEFVERSSSKSASCYPGQGCTEIECPISLISLSKDGKLVGYRKGRNEENCPSIFNIQNSLGDNIGGFGGNQDFVGYVGDENTLVAWHKSTSSSVTVYYNSPYVEKTNSYNLNVNISINRIDFSPDGGFFLVIDGNKYINIYDYAGNLKSYIPHDVLGVISSSSISNNGDVVIFTQDISKGTGIVTLYKLSGDIAFKKEINTKNSFVRISSDGKRIAIVSNDIIKQFNGVIFFDNNGNELWKYNIWKSGNYIESLNDVQIGYDGQYLVVLAHKLIEVLDENGVSLGNRSLIKPASLISISERADYILAASTSRYLYYLDNNLNVKKTIVILSNPIDYELNSNIIGFFENKGLRVIRATATDFDQYKNEKFILILGGPDAYEGVGQIVREVLMNAEQNQIREKGSRKMHVKTNVWTQGQKVFVLAGSNRLETQNAVNDNKAQISAN